MNCSVQKWHLNIFLIFNARKTNQILACGDFGARKHTIKDFPNDSTFWLKSHNAKNVYFPGSFFCHPTFIMPYIHVSKQYVSLDNQ